MNSTHAEAQPRTLASAATPKPGEQYFNVYYINEYGDYVTILIKAASLDEAKAYPLGANRKFVSAWARPDFIPAEAKPRTLASLTLNADDMQAGRERYAKLMAEREATQKAPDKKEGRP